MRVVRGALSIWHEIRHIPPGGMESWPACNTRVRAPRTIPLVPITRGRYPVDIFRCTCKKRAEFGRVAINTAAGTCTIRSAGSSPQICGTAIDCRSTIGYGKFVTIASQWRNTAFDGK